MLLVVPSFLKFAFAFPLKAEETNCSSSPLLSQPQTLQLNKLTSC